MFVPDNFTIDPKSYGEQNGSGSHGTLRILGNLQVEGTYETLNTTVTQNNLEVIDKTITVGSGNASESAGAIISAGLLIGGSTLSTGVLDPLASFTYNFDNTVNTTLGQEDDLSGPIDFYHSRHFKSTIPIRMVDGWRATHDNELITKAQLTENLTTGGGIPYSGLAGIKFKVVNSEDDVTAKFTTDLLNYDRDQKNMIWVLNTSGGLLDFKIDGTRTTDNDNNPMDICEGMNFYVHDPDGNGGLGSWHAQV